MSSHLQPIRQWCHGGRLPSALTDGKLEEQIPGGKGSATVNSISTSGLHPHQVQALEAIETAVSAGIPRMRVALAIGAGKSTVIVHALARLLKAGYTSRPLYLTPNLVQAYQIQDMLLTLNLGETGPLGDIHEVQLLQHENTPGSRDGNITIATYAKFLSLSRAETPPNYDLVILDNIDTSIAWSGARAESVDKLHATLIAFTSSRLPESISFDPLIFTYDVQDALADRVLRDPHQRTASSPADTSFDYDPNYPVHRRRRIYLGAADQDSSAIQRLAGDLSAAGLRLADITESKPLDVAPGDVFIPILSFNSLQTPLVDDFVAQSLERRDVDVIPAVIGDCPIPARIAMRMPVDVTDRTDGLLRRLQASAMVDLEILNPESLERLTVDLLKRLGFTFGAGPSILGGDMGFDLAATFQDADQFGAATEYLVQIKHARASFRDVSGLVRAMRTGGRHRRGMVVTNGHLTSLTENQLARAQGEGAVVQVIDGPRLRSLLLRHPDLISRHFATGSAK